MMTRVVTGFLVALFLLVVVAGPTSAAGKVKPSGCNPLVEECPPVE